MTYERFLTLLIISICLFTSKESASIQDQQTVTAQTVIAKDGVAGKNGIDGKNGVNGKNGKDGLNGKDGINGINGINGVDGKGFETGLHVLVVGDCPDSMTLIGTTGQWALINKDEPTKLWNTGSTYDLPYALLVSECVIN